jgi:hypothetical protein
MRSRYAFLGNCIVFFGLVLASFAALAEQIVVEKDSPLYASPQTSAKVVGQVKQGMTGEALAQKGTWVNVKTDAGTGWLFTFNVRFLTPGASPAAKAAPIIAPRPRVTATIGIRGLEAEDLKNATVDPQQLTLLDSYVASKQDAEKAARASGLAPARVDYLVK